MCDIYIISSHLPFIFTYVVLTIFVHVLAIISCTKKKKENISSIHSSYIEIFLAFNFFILSKDSLLNSPAGQIIQRSFSDEKDLSNERFDGRLKTSERENSTTKKKERKKKGKEHVSHSKCFLPLKRMIFFLSVTLSTIEVAHDQDSTVLITGPRVSFGLQPAMRINDAMSRMHGHSYRTLRSNASTIVNAASFAFIPLIISFRLITVSKTGDSNFDQM